MCNRAVRFDPSVDLASAASAQKYVSRLERELASGNGKAGFVLHHLLGKGFLGGSEEARNYLRQLALDETEILERSFALLHEQAINGDGEAMHFIALYFQSGLPPLTKPVASMFQYWVRKAQATNYGRDQYQF